MTSNGRYFGASRFFAKIGVRFLVIGNSLDKIWVHFSIFHAVGRRPPSQCHAKISNACLTWLIIPWNFRSSNFITLNKFLPKISSNVQTSYLKKVVIMKLTLTSPSPPRCHFFNFYSGNMKFSPDIVKHVIYQILKRKFSHPHF